MTPDGGEYDIRPPEPPPAKPKPGDPDWVEPVPIIEKADPVPAEEAPPPDPDVEKNKGLAILAYIFFVIPLIAAPQSKFARFHANQGLLLFISWFAAFIVIAFLELGKWLAVRFLESIPILSVFLNCIFYLLQPAILVSLLALAIMGIVHAANGEKKVLPLIGHWTLLK